MEEWESGTLVLDMGWEEQFAVYILYGKAGVQETVVVAKKQM